MQYQNAEAGPSSASATRTEHDNTPTTTAPLRPLPATHFYSIEYPGYVQPASVPLAIKNLGGQAHVESAFKRGSSKSESILELNFRPGNSFAHPIPGEVIPTSNILLKVVKRRRKRKDGDAADAPVGEYTVEAMGVISKTARFRSMADYQFQPDTDDSVIQLRQAMNDMDVEGILKYSIPEEREDYTIEEETNDMDIDIDPQLLGGDELSGEAVAGSSTRNVKVKSNLRLPPPPLFSRQGIPQIYNYKANPASVVTTVVDEDTGEEKRRLINRMRWKGFGPIAINFGDKEVPNKPSPIIEEQRAQADEDLLKRLEELFQERPVWTRTAIFNQFNASEVREILNSKYLLPLVSYVFQDGPWRDTQVRLGYDPRKNPEARFYQRVYFRNLNHPITRPSVVTRRQDSRSEHASSRVESGAKDKRSHIFDGLTMSKETAAYQLCDLTDPMLEEMVQNEDDLRETCNERDGWFTTHAFENIKTVLRHKFFALLSGHVATREECEALLRAQEGAEKPRTVHRLRPSKHNMAKGALRPEDAAAQRLMATLDQRAKNFSQAQKQASSQKQTASETETEPLPELEAELLPDVESEIPVPEAVASPAH